ncbi:HAUS augmin-like complex subunit 6 [Nymphon striatum]|nr:HAUS augmin-like complex subunit 6 [Nymphon striatum]
MDGIKQAFFSNILLLGFNPKEMEKAHRIQFHKEMFNIVNKTGFEVITYFMFSKLSPLNLDEFSSCWPVYDAKSTRTFRKVTFQWLTKIMEDKDSRISKFPSSMLISPGGELFIRVYFALSQYVLLKSIKNQCKVRPEDEILFLPNITKGNLRKKCLESFQIGASISINTFIQQVHNQGLKHKEWNVLAKKLEGIYWSLNKLVKDAEANLRNELNLYKSTLAAKPLPAWLTKQILHDAESDDGTMMDSDQFDEFMVLQSDDSVKPIHAAKCQLMWMDPQVSQKYEMLATAAQLKLLLFPTTYLVECAFGALESFKLYNEEGKLVLLNLSKLICTFLKEYGALFNSVKIPEMSETVKKLELASLDHRRQLDSLIDMRNDLEKMLPILRESVSNLRFMNIDDENTKVQILPPTPSMSFSAATQHIPGTTPIRENFVKSTRIFSPNASVTAEDFQASTHKHFKNQDKSEKLYFETSALHQSKIPVIDHPAEIESQNSVPQNLSHCDVITSPKKSPSAYNIQSEPHEVIDENIDVNLTLHSSKPQSISHDIYNSPKRPASVNHVKSKPHKTVIIHENNNSKLHSTDVNNETPINRQAKRLNSVKDSLAEQIVENIMNPDDNLTIDNFIDGYFEPDFDQSAFVSKDVLTRTPPKMSISPPIGLKVNITDSGSFMSEMSTDNVHHSRQENADGLTRSSTPRKYLNLMDFDTPSNRNQDTKTKVSVSCDSPLKPNLSNLTSNSDRNTTFLNNDKHLPLESDLLDAEPPPYCSFIDDLDTSKFLLDESLPQWNKSNLESDTLKENHSDYNITSSSFTTDYVIPAVENINVKNAPQTSDASLNNLIARYSKIRCKMNNIKSSEMEKSEKTVSPEIVSKLEALKPVKLFKLDTALFE